ncbi:mediator of RNA polymerase II transcription subunit [Trema orientale]|uniref:Mediator of RNA polymerase II transcription subunit n=1 Tax=Trema orientale TaxID=63057 RepID=A0A2P5CBY2_TREOI|nr:mediator of RNA polymerase II transcription subunit [Trema orientale]
METTCLCSSFAPLPIKTRRFRKRNQRSVVANAKRSADPYDYYFDGGRLVDESMIILRKRIHEMKVIERNYEPPAEWTNWEKQYYTSYDDYVCKFVGFVQSNLMNTRPSLALGMIFLLALSVPASTVVVLLRLIEVANDTFSSLHLG